jgi:hypothetical protein
MKYCYIYKQLKKEGKEMTNLKLNISFILCFGQKNEPRENEKFIKSKNNILECLS